MGVDTSMAGSGRSAVRAVRAVASTWIVALLCLVPVLTAPVLPLIDFYAHAFRFAILADAGRDPWLAENYRVAWSLLPNLGLDAIGAALFRILPPLPAAGLIAFIAIAAPFLGVLVLARAVQGRVTPLSVALAGILSHSFILGWGFANFLLGLGLALAALGLWIGGRATPGRQLAVAVAAGPAIFLTHGFVFALWGLLLAAVELALAVDLGRPGLRSLPRRAFRLLLVAVLPAALFIASATSGGEGVAGTIDRITVHAGDGSLAAELAKEARMRADAMLRVAESGWPAADRLFGALLWVLLLGGLVSGRLRLDRRLGIAAAGLAGLVVLAPPTLFGVGHLAERIPLVLLAVLAAGVRPARRVAGAGAVKQALVVLLPVHLLMVTLAWSGTGEGYRAFMAAAERLPARALAAPAYAGDSRDRDGIRVCKPLTFLLGLDRGMAVPTFANPTQQPLRITGPLAAAMAEYDRRDAAGSLTGRAQVETLLASGFDAVVLCRAPGVAAEPVAGAQVLGTGRDWILYHALPG